MLSKAASNTIFWVFGMTWPGIEPSFPDHWQTLYSLGQWPSITNMNNLKKKHIHLYVHIYKVCTESIQLVDINNKITYLGNDTFVPFEVFSLLSHSFISASFSLVKVLFHDCHHALFNFINSVSMAILTEKSKEVKSELQFWMKYDYFQKPSRNLKNLLIWLLWMSLCTQAYSIIFFFITNWVTPLYSFFACAIRSSCSKQTSIYIYMYKTQRLTNGTWGNHR